MRQNSVLVVCLLIPSLGLPLAAMAQSNTGSSRVLEEVVVTAEKRSENLQTVPISISVATAKDIADINAFDFKELQKITPGVVFGGGAGLQSAAISIRGVGPTFFALGTPPNVAVFVDQFAQAQIGAVFSTLVDIQQVELLRGPQGTLYGRNAPGGAYNINTRNPNFDGINGYVQGSYSLYDSTDLATQDVRAAVNLPLFDDTLAWRIAGVYSDSDGFVDVENSESSINTTGGKDNKAVRSKMLWQPSDVVDLLWIVNYQDLEQNPPGFNYDGLVPGTGGTEASPVPAIYNDFDKRDSYASRGSEVTGKIKDTGLHLTWDTNLGAVDALAFYQDLNTSSDEDREPYPGGVSTFQIDADSNITTFELRLSDNGDKFDYIAGLYYFDTTIKTTTFVIQQGVDVNGAADGDTEGYAAFGNVNFHLAPEWDLSLGLRYDDIDDSLTASTTFTGINAALDDQKLEFDHVSWSVKLSNYISEDLMVYLSVDHAFKQGGFNGLVAGVAALSDGFGFPIPPAVALAAADTLTYEEETSDAIELGIKGTFLDDRLSLGADIFYQRYKDHQVAQTNQGVDAFGFLFTSFFLASIANAEEVNTQGIEFQAQYLLGEYWDVALRTAYSEPTVDEWSTRFCPSGENTTPDQVYCPLGDGDELNNLPKWNSNVQLGYSRPLQGAWELYSRASWTWQSAPAGTTITNDFSESKSLLGLTLGFKESDLGLNIKAWVKNVTDEDRNINPGRKKNGDDALPSAFQGSFSPGREFGVTVRYDF
ncbi:MAG: TonB-dependent receptor [Halioglobus sp.]|nr:TonB-dependent receptor [Halioglobus sp.]